MTTKLEAAARQALGALEQAGYGVSYAAIDLREALAEQERQKPVASVSLWHNHGYQNRRLEYYGNLPDGLHPLYAAPVSAKREWVELTCQEVTALIMEGAAGGGWQGFAERVQAAYKEKNCV